MQPTSRCSGSADDLKPSTVNTEGYYERLSTADAPRRLIAKEHTAPIDQAERAKRENAFKEGRIETLVCSPTLEPGVNIGDLLTVVLEELTHEFPRLMAEFVDDLDHPTGLTTEHLEPVRDFRKCLHFYHYFQDPTFGFCHVRVQSWYPFTADICLNGRARLARPMDRQKLAYRRADHCFLHLAQPAAAQKLADQQLQLDWPTHLNRLLALAHPLHRQVLVPLYHQQYYWTTTESEYATDLLFKDPAQLAQLYPCFVHHGIMTFRSLFCHGDPRAGRYREHRNPELRTTVRH